TRLRVEELEGRLVLAQLSPISTTSIGWSGYAVVSRTGTVTYVLGSWTVPAVDPTSTGAIVAWVGIDGAVNNMVEQIGTLSSNNSGFTPSYFAWYQMYPLPYHQLFPVNPGDSMTASVTYQSGKLFALNITDNTSHVSQSVQATTLVNAPRSSAEW